MDKSLKKGILLIVFLIVIITIVFSNNVKVHASSVTVDLLTHSELNYPNEVAVDSSGNMYIADTWNNAIKKITVTPPTAVLLSADSVSGAAAGDAEITGLDSTKTYNVEIMSGSDNGKYVNGTGSISTAAADVTGVSEITG